MVNTDILLKEVRRNKQYFDAMIFWRDVREAGGSFLMMFVFVYLAIKDAYMLLLAPALVCLFVAIFMVIDRVKLKNKFPFYEKNASLEKCIRVSLGHVNHQIWLLKNVSWWYLLPFAIGVSIPFFEGAWNLRNSEILIPFLIKTFGFLIILYIGVYCLNQYTVKKDLIPRKEELEELLKSIENHSQDTGSN
jgi:hypothetical protein